MAHSLKLSCPNCKQRTHGFKDVSYSLLEGGGVLLFEAFCETCRQPVFTQIGVQVFAEWAALDDLKVPPHDEPFLRDMNITWNDSTEVKA
jgi:hypothetical protein